MKTLSLQTNVSENGIFSGSWYNKHRSPKRHLKIKQRFTKLISTVARHLGRKLYYSKTALLFLLVSIHLYTYQQFLHVNFYSKTGSNFVPPLNPSSQHLTTGDFKSNRTVKSERNEWISFPLLKFLRKSPRKGCRQIYSSSFNKRSLNQLTNKL